MNKRNLIKKLDRLATRAQVRQVGLLQIIDTADFNWEAFRQADATSRAKLRQAYIDRIAQLNVETAEGSDAEGVREVLVTVYVPGPEDEWRYFEADND